MGCALENLRLILADDHAVVRMGFRMLLEGAGAAVVAEAACGEDAVALFAEHRPNVMVMDVTMPGLGGLGALERLIAHHPAARVLMLSAHFDAQTPLRALKAGAAGYLCKQAQPGELIRAVAQVARGGRYLDPELAPQLALAQLSGGADPLAALTDKEFAVFMKLAQGMSTNDIARSQKLSASTVGTHLYHIKQKLDVRSAAELALIAVRSGLVEARAP